MAQSSGFFESRWDETLINPETGTLGDWDVKYYYNQFSDYFSKFFGNGVYYNPDDNLKVLSNGGMTITVKTGWAFINGYWFHLDADATLGIPVNTTAYDRTDSVLLRWNLSNREISLVYASDTVDLVRTDTVYELKLAQIIVGSNVAVVLGDVITDTRMNQEVCGVVRGLVSDSIDTGDLFAQYDSIFNEWFDGIKDQLIGDLAVRLQLEFSQLKQDVVDYENDVQTQISNYETQIANQISGYNTNYQNTLNEAQGLIDDYVNKDYVISETLLNFTDKVCVVSDNKITSNSLIDVYFTSDTINYAEDCKIYVDSVDGAIVLTAEVQPTQIIKAMFRVRIR